MLELKVYFSVSAGPLDPSKHNIKDRKPNVYKLKVADAGGWGWSGWTLTDNQPTHSHRWCHIYPWPFVYQFVCEQYYAKTPEKISNKLGERMEHVPRKKYLHFGIWQVGVPF